MVKTTNVSKDFTMVWYLDKLKNVAITADVEKYPAGWKVSFGEKQIFCINTKANALSVARRLVKESYVKYKEHFDKINI